MELETSEDGDDVELTGLDKEDLETSEDGDDVEAIGLDEEDLDTSEDGDDVERIGLDEEEAGLDMKELLDKLEAETYIDEDLEEKDQRRAVTQRAERAAQDILWKQMQTRMHKESMKEKRTRRLAAEARMRRSLKDSA